MTARGSVLGASSLSRSISFFSRLLSVYKVCGQGTPALSCSCRVPPPTNVGGPPLCHRRLVSSSSPDLQEGAKGGGGPPEGTSSVVAEDEGLASADSQYQAAATCLLEGLAEQIQEVQETSKLEDVDYGASSGFAAAAAAAALAPEAVVKDGVLKIVCEGGVTLVLNKHYVTKQIWYASPLSGARYFDYALGWVCGRTGADLLEILSQDVERATGHRPPPLSWPVGSRGPLPQTSS
ncbi:hypothetical protein ACSSS7_005499 [Eimeria intestinalis]